MGHAIQFCEVLLPHLRNVLAPRKPNARVSTAFALGTTHHAHRSSSPVTTNWTFLDPWSSRTALAAVASLLRGHIGCALILPHNGKRLSATVFKTP
eukprot:scaffold121013_cov26-Tisochrysis_lutea.AAC.4